MNLSLNPERLSVCQLPADAPIPAWATAGRGFCSITRTTEELSIVCAETGVPAGTRQEAGWRAFKVEGPLDFALTGILSSLAAPLAQAGISIYAVSTYHTDYVLVKAAKVDEAVRALRRAGHVVRHD
jgi:hypothetical protein